MNDFTQYIETQTQAYRKKWLNKVIQEYRSRISNHLKGERDLELEKYLLKKKETIMNDTDTLNKFMRGILQVDIIAQALFEPNTRNVPKEHMLVDYLQNQEVEISVEELLTQYKEHQIELAIWSDKSNEAGVVNRFRKLSNQDFQSPCILIADGPKIKPEHLSTLEGKDNLIIFTVNEFIQWAKKN